MSLLGDVLDHFFGRTDPFQTLRATIQQSNNAEVAKRAKAGASTQWGRQKLSAGTNNLESQRIVEKTISVWMAMPSRVRIEEQGTVNASDAPSLKVVNGDCWTTLDAEGHVESGKDCHVGIRRASKYVQSTGR